MTSPYAYTAGIRRVSNHPEQITKSFTPFIRLSLISLTLLCLVLINITLNSTPWISKSFSPFSPSLLVNSKSRTTNLKKGSTPAVKGCQDVSKTKLEQRENGVIVLLVRESDEEELIYTLMNFEEKFNKNFRYPYLFIASPDNPPFSEEFQLNLLDSLPEEAKVEWSTVSVKDWSIPKWMNELEIKKGFEKMEIDGVQYAGREGYHHMCRFYSGVWAKMEALSNYDWYWRLEPGVQFYSTITYDPFRFLSLNKKIYGFVITIIEDIETIPTLFKTIQNYAKQKNLIPNQNLWNFFTRKQKDSEGVVLQEDEYTLCHFWTNFEIGDLRFFRSQAYQDLFNYLDQQGGFYTERWGDAPIRSLALGLLANVDQIHFFADIAYQHDNFLHCPSTSSGLGCELDCPRFSKKENVDIDNDYWYSCLPRWKEVSENGRHLDSA